METKASSETSTTPPSKLEPSLEFALTVERAYAALIIAGSVPASGEESSLGGKLLFAGTLDTSRALVVAANIAGAATLAATADGRAGKQAMRDGIVDFLVASLDEALRILKNEIRKRETVAVCIGAAPEEVTLEMIKRGVVPDIALPIELATPEENETLLTWRIASAPALWLPKLDALALDCFSEDSTPAATAARRWLRLSPRYLGRLAQGVRVLRCNEQTAAKIRMRMKASQESGEISVPVEIEQFRVG